MVPKKWQFKFLDSHIFSLWDYNQWHELEPIKWLTRLQGLNILQFYDMPTFKTDLANLISNVEQVK